MKGNLLKKYVIYGFLIICFFEITYHVYVNESIARKIQETVNKLINGSVLNSMESGIIKNSLGGSQCENPKQLINLNDFFNYGKTNGKGNCVNLAIIGGHKETFEALYPYRDGARTLCLDGIKRDNCIVLSFDVGSDYTFDNDVEYIAGCKVYMFNPYGERSFKNPPNMEFYNIGISDKKETIRNGNRKEQFDRYEGILQMINLTKHSIDYIKIDIDGSELAFFRDVFDTSLYLLENVNQIGMEIHPILTKTTNEDAELIKAFQPYWDVMHRLECLGFDLISFVPSLLQICKFNYYGHEVSGCYDVVFSKRIAQVLGLK